MNQGVHPTCLTGHRDRTVVDDVVGPLGGILVETVDVQPGQRVLDVAAGTQLRPAGDSSRRVGDRHADHVRSLFGDRVTDLVAHQQTLPVDRFSDGSEFRDMKANYGPTIAVYRFIADDPAKVAGLDAARPPWGDRFLHDGTMSWE